MLNFKRVQKPISYAHISEVQKEIIEDPLQQMIRSSVIHTQPTHTQPTHTQPTHTQPTHTQPAQSQPIQPMIINVNHQQDDQIMVETDYVNNRFSFFDSNKNFRGSFDVIQLFRYIVYHNAERQTDFMNSIDYESARPIIERFICKNNSKGSDLVVYLDSPFMGNIKTLINLYKMIESYEKIIIPQYLQKMENINDREYVTNRIERFIGDYITYVLGVISMVSNKSELYDRNIRHTLLDYTITLMVRLQKNNQQMIHQKIQTIETLEKDLTLNKQEMNRLLNIIDKLQHVMTKTKDTDSDKTPIHESNDTTSDNLDDLLSTSAKNSNNTSSEYPTESEMLSPGSVIDIGEIINISDRYHQNNPVNKMHLTSESTNKINNTLYESIKKKQFADHKQESAIISTHAKNSTPNGGNRLPLKEIFDIM